MKRPPARTWLGLAIIAAFYAISVHIEFIICVFDPVFHSDSPGYFLGVLESLSGLPFRVLAIRTYGYPWFIYLVMKCFGSFFAVVIIQHVLVLFSGVLAGLICFRVLRSNPIAAWICAIFSAIMPPSVVLAHAILSDVLYGFLLLSGLALYFLAIKQQRKSLWVACGIVIALALVVRPIGWGLVLALLVGTLLSGKRVGPWKGPLSGFVSFAALVFIFCGWSTVQRGFFGLDQFTGFTLIGPTARYLEWERVKEPDVREALRPIYEKDIDKLLDPAWVRFSTAGVVGRLRTALGDERRLDKALTRISVQAITHHPFRVAFDQWRLFSDVFWKRNGVPGVYRDLSFSFFVYRGALIYRHATEKLGNAARYAPIGTGVAAAFLEAMNRLLKLPDHQAEQAFLDLRKLDLYQSSGAFRLLAPIEPIIDQLNWLPLCALVGGIVLAVLAGVRWETFVVSLVILLHLLLTNLGADADRRHLLPIEPLMWALVLASLSLAAERLRQTLRKIQFHCL